MKQKIAAAVYKENLFYLEVNPVHCIPHILEHALVRHEQVSIFEASFTAKEFK